MKKSPISFFLCIVSSLLLIVAACHKSSNSTTQQSSPYHISWSGKHHYPGNYIYFATDAPSGTAGYWDFGDNSAKVSGASPWHRYQYPGTYTVTVTIQGLKTTTTVKIDAVTARPGLEPRSTGVPISFFTSLPIDTAVYWDFGDGTTSTLPATSHTYSVAGNYTVTTIVANDSETLATYDFSIGKYPSLASSISGTHVWHHNTYWLWNYTYTDNYAYYPDTTFAVNYISDFVFLIGVDSFKYSYANDSEYRYSANSGRQLQYKVSSGRLSLFRLYPPTGDGHALSGTIDEYYTP